MGRWVDTYIHYLRDKIDSLRDKIDVGASPRLLHTIRGVGYLLWAE
jgi:DNA-binding response OmpR family regulator